jgi:alpha-L-fucosidase
MSEIGARMEVNGESIYGTTATPFHRLTWGRCTRLRQGYGGQAGQGEILSLHVFHWPQDGKLVVPGLRSVPRESRFLADGRRLAAKPTEEAALSKYEKRMPGVLPTRFNQEQDEIRRQMFYPTELGLLVQPGRICGICL